MILEVENWHLGYSQILADCRPDEHGLTGKALILCNADVDALSAARILTYMLRNDGIAYQLIPCMSYSQLVLRLAQNKADGYRAIILLNLGANRNLKRLFEGTDPGLDLSAKVFVVDCRRPVHLANIHAGSNVVVFWDVQHDDDTPSDGEDLSGNDSSSSEESDDEEDEDSMDQEEEFDEHDGDEEAEFGDEEDRDSALAPHAENAEHPSKEDDSIDDTTALDPDDGEDIENQEPMRQNQVDIEEDDDKFPGKEAAVSENQENPPSSEPKLTPKEMQQQRRARLRSYYAAGNYYGSPASFVTYRIATQMRFNEVSDLLWLSCVGVTDAYLHARLDKSGYSTLAMQLRNKCISMFPNDSYHRVTSAVFAEDLTGGPLSDSQERTRIALSENGKILAETDFRFFMLRHTSLLDAMYLSDYISTRFQLLTSRGMLKLKELLARMGYPLEQCRQPFAFMKPSLRRRLRSEMLNHAEEYGLMGIEYTSFFRITGHSSLLSAADVSYAVTALLECDGAAHGDFRINRGSDSEEEALFKSFNLALDALNVSSAPSTNSNTLSGESNGLVSLVNGASLSSSIGLGAGIRLAISLQKTIMSTAASLVERNAIVRLSHFRYAYITCTSQAESHVAGDDNIPMVGNQGDGEDHAHQVDHVFAKPLALSRLAHYLMDLHRENGKWAGAKSRPLVLMAERPATETYVVVGLEYPENSGDFVRNRFCKNFELAAQSMKGRFRFDSFDSHVVEVHAGDVQRFIEQLHYLLDSV